MQKSYFLWEFHTATLYVCPKQSHALGTRTKFQLEILTMNVISGIIYFHEIILESLWNISGTTPRSLSFIREDFKYICYSNVESWYEIWINIYFSS